jgi:transcription initiation factor TFIID subunit TAF12
MEKDGLFRSAIIVLGVIGLLYGFGCSNGQYRHQNEPMFEKNDSNEWANMTPQGKAFLAGGLLNLAIENERQKQIQSQEQQQEQTQEALQAVAAPNQQFWKDDDGYVFVCPYCGANVHVPNFNSYLCGNCQGRVSILPCASCGTVNVMSKGKWKCRGCSCIFICGETEP